VDRTAGDAELIGEEVDDRLVCPTVDRWRGGPDLKGDPILYGNSIATGTGVDVYGDARQQVMISE